MRNPRRLFHGKTSRFASDRSGAAAVEFAFISGIFLLLMAAAIDLTRAVIAQRDINRITVETSQTLSGCKNSDCVLTTISTITAKQANIFLNTPGAAIGMAEITRVSGAILVLQGTMTYLPSDVNTEALNVLSDGDVGVCSLVTYSFTPAMAGVTNSWSTTLGSFRSYRCAMRAKNIKMV